jgi:creatinine amidohydrolase
MTAWPDMSSPAVLVVPVGSYEQHGPHLPLHTDTTIAVAVATRVASALGAVVGPPLAYGASGEHQDFPGTVSIGTAALTTAIVELGRSASTWAGRVVLVNGHGGNVAALRAAVAQLTAESRDVAWIPCATGDGDAHAGYVETSVMLHLAPHEVRMSHAEAGNREPLERLLPALVAHGVRAVSPNGVLGDPTGATAEAGAALLAEMVDRATAAVHSGWTG